MTRSKPKRTHTLPPTTPLSQQVGGHAGVHVTEDESLLLKPALPREIAFYQFVRDGTDPATGLHRLVDWIPQFFGLLSLQGSLANADAGIVGALGIDAGTVPAAVDPASGDLDGTDTADMPGPTLVLQNLLHGYRKPCILDVKLGTILYDDDASEEKKARMIKKAAESTTLTTGIRLTGFQVYSNHAPDPIVYGKAYGYGLRPDQLQEGIAQFFPCSTPSKPGAGLPADTLMTLLTSLCDSLTDLRASLTDAHVRIVGSSVLIIYEGNWDRAAAASGRGGGPGDVEDAEDDGADSDEIEVEVDERGEIVIESIPGTSSDGSSSDPPPRLYTVSLIDFAHTRIVPGEGPDQGVLTGMNTLISLVDRRKQQVAALIEADQTVD